jgi:SH3-like domain-containing protein
MPKIIISYRRADTLDIAMRIRDGLKSYYGDESVFTDIHNIPAGEKFLDYINKEIESADVLLAVVGPRWLRAERSEPDYVRLEIEAALNKTIKIVPVLVLDAKMPRAEKMPASIRAFVDLNAAQVRSDVSFENSLKQLIGSLDKYFASLPKRDEKQIQETKKPPVEIISDKDDHGQPFTGRIARFKTAYREIPVLGFAIGASVIAALAALVLGFFGYPRASLIVFCAMMIAMALVFICSQLTSHRSSVVARFSVAAIWIVSLVFISFLALTATAAGLKWPSLWAEALGYEVEDSICYNPLATQKAYSCDTDGDWVVVGVDLDDSDKVTLNIRPKPDSAMSLRAIPPNSTKLLVGVCTENWCPVKCESIEGWSKKKFLQPRSEQLYPTQGSSLPGASGLAIRSGPHQTCHAEGFVQSGRKVILHGCEPNPTDQTQRWCRITHDLISGWLPDLNLDFSKGLPQPNLESSK